MDPTIPGAWAEGTARPEMEIGGATRCIPDALPIPLLVVSDAGTIRYLNPRAASLFSVDCEDAVGTALEEVLSAGSALTLKKIVARTANFSVASEGTLRHAYREYVVHAAPLKCGDGTPATVVVLHPMSGKEHVMDLTPKTCPDGSGHWVPIFVPADR